MMRRKDSRWVTKYRRTISLAGTRRKRGSGRLSVCYFHHTNTSEITFLSSLSHSCPGHFDESGTDRTCKISDLFLRRFLGPGSDGRSRSSSDKSGRTVPTVGTGERFLENPYVFLSADPTEGAGHRKRSNTICSTNRF